MLNLNKITNTLLFILLCSWASLAQNSQNITLLYQYDDPSVSDYNDIWGYANNGSEVAIIGTRDSILFFDVTNTNQVVKLQGIAPGGSSTWRDFKTYQNYCYGVTEASEGLTIVNMTDLLSGTLTYQTINSDFVSAHNLWIDTSKAKLYVVGADNASGARMGLIIYDLGPDPYNPTLLASYNFPDVLNLCGGASHTYVHDIHVRNDTAYCNMEVDCGYQILDMSNPDTPFYLGDMPSSAFQNGYNHSNWVSADGNYAAVAEESSGNPVHFVDVSDPWNLNVVSTYKDPLLQGVSGVIAHNPFIKGNLCYISYYHDGVIILDISNINNPTRVAYYDTEPNNTDYNGFEGAWGVYPYLPSGNLLASDMNNGLFVLEVDETILAVDWLRFQVKNERRRTFDVEAELQSTQSLEKAELYWSPTGEDFRLLSALNAEREKQNEYKVSQNLERPSSKSFYVQIRTTEVDGYKSKSVVRRVQAADGATFSIFPNPSVDEVFVEHENANRLELYNMNGELVQEQALVPGINKIVFQHGVIPGAYTLVLKGRDNTILERAKLMVNP